MKDAVYRKNPNMVFREIAGEMILVPINRRADEADSIFVLNETGALVWEFTDGVRSLGRIAEMIMEEYLTERETVEKDLEKYIGDMLSAGALEAV
ncbi:MAG: PqqD family protein [Candidatus Fermentibacteraceae bacterium]|nr:PqqD family protein [Candidatus Fermentibacteraceae bacterium]MBN2609163.1 PqqD family protein [Candidatus Fermentibacteraceae bacterium]